MGRKRNERGSVLIEFALVSVVFFTMLIGGLFVFTGIIAKSQAVSGTASAANFVADGGCPTTSTTASGASPTTQVICADGAQPPESCTTTPIAEYNPADPTNTSTTLYLDPGSTPQDAATVATICEVDQIIGNSLFDTDQNSLQVAIDCLSPPNTSTSTTTTTTTVPGSPPSGEPCANSTAVWVCARAWDSNAYAAVIGPSWIGSQSEQMVPVVPTTTSSSTSSTSTSSTSTTSTTTAPTTSTSALPFETFYPANTYNTTPALTSCGP